MTLALALRAPTEAAGAVACAAARKVGGERRLGPSSHVIFQVFDDNEVLVDTNDSTRTSAVIKMNPRIDSRSALQSIEATKAEMQHENRKLKVSPPGHLPVGAPAAALERAGDPGQTCPAVARRPSGHWSTSVDFLAGDT